MFLTIYTCIFTCIWNYSLGISETRWTGNGWSRADKDYEMVYVGKDRDEYGVGILLIHTGIQRQNQRDNPKIEKGNFREIRNEA
ncbi:hypothetical protein PGB90_004495 [Kerria lacca]